ncbi:MAG: MFS transporter [Novosphingobium sp.]|nr:MFS transporter [Novosphingobium sp.]
MVRNAGTSAKLERAPKDVRRTFATKLFYGIGSIAYGVKDNGFSVLLLLYYNQVLGLNAGLAGLAIMIALVVDAFVDPLIGYLSDHMRSRFGRRHPFMYAAAIPVAVSYLFLFSPPAGLSQQALFTYLLVVAVIVRCCIACYEIPSSALVAELSDSYDQRTNYLSFRFFFGWVGGLTMSILAYAVFLKPTKAFPIGQLNPAGYAGYGVAAALIMFLAIVISSLGTHRAIPFLRKPAERAPGSGGRIASMLRAINSRSALAALGAGMLIALATGLNFALSPYFMTYFWGLRADQMSMLVAGNFVAALLALLFTPLVSRLLDKRSASIIVALTLLVLIPLTFGLRYLGLMPPNGSTALVTTLFFFGIVTAALSIMWGILLSSMLADVVEDTEVRTGQRSEGVFFAANMFLAKCVSGLGIFFSSAILALVRFPAQAKPGSIGSDILWGLTGIYLSATLILLASATCCILMYRITRTSHLQNLEILAGRQVEAGQPQPGGAT